MFLRIRFSCLVMRMPGIHGHRRLSANASHSVVHHHVHRPFVEEVLEILVGLVVVVPLLSLFVWLVVGIFGEQDELGRRKAAPSPEFSDKTFEEAARAAYALTNFQR